MIRIGAHLAIWMSTIPGVATAGEISGQIIIDRSFNTRTIAPGVYELRGASTRGRTANHDQANEYDRVAVWLEPENGDAPAAAPLASSIQQRDRRFDPELVVVPVGSTLTFPNEDPIFHNIFSLSRTQSFDLGYYPKGQSRSVKFQRAGVVQVYCHVHPNMYAAIVVTSSPWFGKPAPDGTVFWKEIPAGKYRMMAWHKVAGLFRTDVVVPESGQVNVRFSIPIDEAQNDR
jgi:plastocyanin